MSERTASLLYLVAAGVVTALACGLGAVPVMFFHDRLGRLRPVLQGAAIGLMVTASVTGLLRPALQTGGPFRTGAGFLVGVLFFLVTHWLMRGREVQVGDLRGKGVRKSVLVFAVLFIHSLPEGMAMGSAQASGTTGLSLFIVAAIALQNVPEGTAVAIPMADAGFGRGAQFWGAVLTSIPQPIGAPLAFLLVQLVAPLLPLSMAFAGGAMIAVSAVELAPEALGAKTWKRGAVGSMAGGAVMGGLALAFGI